MSTVPTSRCTHGAGIVVAEAVTLSDTLSMEMRPNRSDARTVYR